MAGTVLSLLCLFALVPGMLPADAPEHELLDRRRHEHRQDSLTPAAVLVTVVFALVHLPEALMYAPAWIGISLMGTLTVLLRIATRPLVPGIAAHASYNLWLTLALYAGVG
jgi:membrane protease YdiL (CAAX protease family)